MKYSHSVFFTLILLFAGLDLWLAETPLEGHVVEPAFFAGGPDVATYSLVARDPETKELGVAVQSKYFAVGSVVPWARAGVGAAATQARANPTYPEEVLRMLEGGDDNPEGIVKNILKRDEDSHRRQIGVVSASGKTYSFTGEGCPSWAASEVGENFAAQGNSLANADVIPAMVEAFENTEGELGERMLAALEAAELAGGDKRGKQSAALLIVREHSRPSPHTDKYRDLRVDDHPEPLKELRRLYELHTDLWPSPETKSANKRRIVKRMLREAKDERNQRFD